MILDRSPMRDEQIGLAGLERRTDFKREKARRSFDQRSRGGYRQFECRFMARSNRQQGKFDHGHMRELLVHRIEEIFVRLAVLDLVEQELHRVDGAHLHEDAA